MSLDVYLSIFTLMLISLGINVLSNKTRIPYTVLLVIAGSFLVPLSDIETFSFITSFQLSPELLFFIFLPVLIFESAYNMNVRNISDNKSTIIILAVLGLLISTLCIGFAGHYAFGLIGFEMPILVTLLFGAIISATDPVAVLALFKECGAPHRLTLIFEGESLFNDGTAFALFLVFLEIMIHGYQGYSTLIHAVIDFFVMILGGIIFGLIMGFLFSKLIEWVKGNEHLEITLTLLVAHFTFLLAELISETWTIYGHAVHISSIIATMTASMVMGNYGRFKMSTSVESYMEKFWSYFAFVANSLVFILMGLLFTNLSISLNIAILPIFVIIMVVAVARALSIYISMFIANQFTSEETIPMNWQHLLSWGSLRGAIAIIMALLIPDDLTLPNWQYDYSLKEFITAITIGSIYFSLFIKAPTIKKLVRGLKIDALLPHEQMSYYKSKAYIMKDLMEKGKELHHNHYLSHEQYLNFEQKFHQEYQSICRLCQENSEHSSHVVENMLRIYTLAIQKHELKEMFRHNEINESIYKKNLNILETQTENVEQDHPKLKSLNAYITSWAGKLLNFLQRLTSLKSKALSEPEELFLYYRTQYRLLNKVLEELSILQNSPLFEVFDDPKAINNVIKIYQDLIHHTMQQMQKHIQSNQALLDELNERSANKLLLANKNDKLSELWGNEVITTKLYIMLHKEFNP